MLPISKRCSQKNVLVECACLVRDAGIDGRESRKFICSSLQPSCEDDKCIVLGLIFTINRMAIRNESLVQVGCDCFILSESDWLVKLFTTMPRRVDPKSVASGTDI